MRILLTGSSGWLGRFLAPRLRQEGHHVTGLDVAPGNDTHILGSVADRALVERTFGDHGIQAVIHSGALHKPDIARYPRRAFVDVNVTGTLNLLEAAAAAGNDRFVFTSTTSLMVSETLHGGHIDRAAWMTEEYGPLEPRNVYGITKLAAEQLCRLANRDHGLAVCILRTSRFFPEDDDTHRLPSGPNLKANEFLNRRLTVEDAVEAHVAALAKAPELGFGAFIVSAPPPFSPEDCDALAVDAASVVASRFPEAPDLYARAGWTLPRRIDRIYVPAAAEARLGFRARTDFASILEAIAQGGQLPFVHDPSYVTPQERAGDKATC